jgi:hypothetical protein
MRNAIKLLTIAICFAITSTAHAGSAPDSTSNTNGYFLGFPSGTYISPNHSSEYISVLESVCKKNGRLWALGVNAQLRCTGTTYIEEGGNGSVIEVTIKSSKPIKERPHALLFSVTPFPTAAWTIRDTTTAEVRELKRERFLKKASYKRALKNIDLGKVIVVEPFNRKIVIYVIPWRVSDDGIVEDKDYIIGLRSPAGKYSFVESRGTIVGYADLNGDGVPEIQESTNCDGTCESVMSVHGRPVHISISNH